MAFSLHYKVIILTAVFLCVAAQHRRGGSFTNTLCTTSTCTSETDSDGRSTTEHCTSTSSSCTKSTESSSSSSSKSDASSTTKSTESSSSSSSESDASSTTKLTTQSTTKEMSTTESTRNSNETRPRATASKSLYQTPSMSSSASPSESSREKTNNRKSKAKTSSISASPTRSVSMTTSSVGLSNQEETKEDFVLKMDREFTQDLQDKDSQAYKDLAKKVEEELTKVLKNETGFDRVEVNDFKPGSIMTSASAYFSSSSSSRRSIRSTLDEAHQIGSLSSLGVSGIKYQEADNPRSGGEDGEMSTFTYVLIAVGVVAGIAVCVVIISKVRNKVEARSKTATKKQQEMEDIKPVEDAQTTKQV